MSESLTTTLPSCDAHDDEEDEDVLFRLPSLDVASGALVERARLCEVHAAAPRCDAVCTRGERITLAMPWCYRLNRIDAVLRATNAPIAFEVAHADGRVVGMSVVRAAREARAGSTTRGGGGGGGGDGDGFVDPSRAGGGEGGGGEVSIVALLTAAWRELHVPWTPRQHDAERCAALAGGEEGVRGHARVDARVDVRARGDAPSTATPSGAQLFTHQVASIQAMRRVEASRAFSYAGNLYVGDGWYVDTERGHATRAPSWREATLRAGVLADAAGTGKTLTVLEHCRSAASPPAQRDDDTLRSRGVLVVVPLHLPSHWAREAARFYPDATVVRLIHGRDARTATLRTLLDADVVIATAHVLCASASYRDVVVDAVHAVTGVERADCRSAAAVAAWRRALARRPPAERGEAAPVLEGVHWRRVVVDEVHDVVRRPKLLKAIGGLRCDFLWAVSATPPAADDDAHHLYGLMLEREKPHHPNLLWSMLRHGVVCSTPRMPLSRVTLRLNLVRADARQRDDMMQTLAPGQGVATAIRRSVAEGTTDDVEAWDAGALLARWTHDEPGGGGGGGGGGGAPLHGDGDGDGVPFLEQGVRALAGDGARAACPICLHAARGVIAGCGHAFCRECVTRLFAANGRPAPCPLCRAPISSVAGLVLDSPSGARIARVADLVQAIAEPVLVFAQWKTALRQLRALLRARHHETPVPVHTLEGNATQRDKTLRVFAATGGVLLLSLDESFAGLHFPHINHVVFVHALVGGEESVRAAEYQAISRCVRHGRADTAFLAVHSFVIAEFVEEDLWRKAHEHMAYLDDDQ
jgi:hypothetical protein